MVWWLQDKLPFPYDLERVIDDWVLMGFLVGNDFIPHLPHLHINTDALPLLWRTYKTVMPQLDGTLWGLLAKTMGGNTSDNYVLYDRVNFLYTCTCMRVIHWLQAIFTMVEHWIYKDLNYLWKNWQRHVLTTKLLFGHFYNIVMHILHSSNSFLFQFF